MATAKDARITHARHQRGGRERSNTFQSHQPTRGLALLSELANLQIVVRYAPIPVA
jgi:hypothetical protein